jgi:hypothetical protein
MDNFRRLIKGTKYEKKPEDDDVKKDEPLVEWDGKTIDWDLDLDDLNEDDDSDDYIGNGQFI